MVFRIWNVSGGLYGLTCNQGLNPLPQQGDPILCKNVSIPSCVDRHVYCSYPPMKNTTINSSPSPLFGDPKAPCQLTQWMNSDSGGVHDKETLDALTAKYGAYACSSPDQIFVRVAGTKQNASASSPQIFRAFDAKTGFICDGKDQQSGVCFDYEVQLCCPRK